MSNTRTHERTEAIVSRPGPGSERERGSSRRVPRATYRLQLSKAFDLDAAAAVVPYLARLGVSHIYLSPILTAAPGSTHGYDVVDHRHVNPELGGRSALDRLRSALDEHRMSIVLDIVPNHMGMAGRLNRQWWDVLKHGRQSRYADFFDIDWDAPEAKLRGKVLLPVLGDQLGRVIEKGELRIEPAVEGPVVKYYDAEFPLSPESLARFEDPLRRGAVEEPEVLASLLDHQHYRLAHWKTASRELNYRRFFAVNNLAAIRVERPEVFAETHELILQLVESGAVDGLRIDHPDGLRDPTKYLDELRDAAGNAWITVEKILEPGEPLPPEWKVAGTTGYDFLNRAMGVFVDPAGEEPMTDFFREFTGIGEDYHALLHKKKHFVLDTMFGGELNRLLTILAEICGRNRLYRDHTRRELCDALAELLACFPVYRTYPRSDCELSEQDLRVTREAVACAKRHRPDVDARLFDFIGEILSMRVPGEQEAEFTLRFGQLSGPVMAKGAEDTTFYIYNRFTALNEVGGDPGSFGLSVEDFHAINAERQQNWPAAMLGTSTHDTKRSEDVRARLCVLSEMPDAWRDAVTRWREMNAPRKNDGLPDANSEYLLYQTLVGAWPIGAERAIAYMEKATREASVQTTWTAPNEKFESALKGFIEGVLGDAAFVRDLESFVGTLVGLGRINSLAQSLLKLTCPGVPDVYQGTELWDLSLVDPDNRRPVDYEARRALLDAAEHANAEEAMRRSDEGLPKLFLLRRALRVRAEHPEAFGAASGYTPLAAAGGKAGHVVAYERGGRVVTVVPRLPRGLGDGWGDTSLRLPAPGRWRNVFTEELREGETRVGDLLRAFPVALLVRENKS